MLSWIDGRKFDTRCEERECLYVKKFSLKKKKEERKMERLILYKKFRWYKSFFF